MAFEAVDSSLMDGEFVERPSFGCVKYSGSLGRKRIVSSDVGILADTSAGPLKRQCSGRLQVLAEESVLEMLPQDVLIRILCCVYYNDLKQLIRVSKSIKDAAVVAKEAHFAYKTPSKTRAFRTSIDLEDPSLIDSIESPKAPIKRRLCRRKLVEISTVLFDD